MTARLLRNHRRRDGIGASELPAIAGASPWTTPVAVWLEKVGLGQGTDDTPAMRAGRELEAPILRAGMLQAEHRLTHNAQTFGGPEWPAVRLYATPDAWGPGRRCIAEVKLAGRTAGAWAEGPPDYVGLQVQGQLHVTGADHAHVIALVGAEIRHYRVEPDPVAQAELPEAVRAWWERHVIAGVAPEAGTPGDVWALLRARSAHEGRPERLATPDELERGAALLATLAERDRLDDQADSLRQGLAGIAEQSDVIGLGWTARWGLRRAVDWRGLARAAGIEPETIAEHTKATATFTFRRTGVPDE